MDTTVADPVVGRLLDGRYMVRERLASGGMATVYVAHDNRLDRLVALKIMHPALAHDAEFVARFHREATAAARLNSPHVVSILDQGSDSDATGPIIYLVMELIRGRTLRQLIAQRGRVPVPVAFEIMEPVAAALAAAHSAGLLHRDIKPENILLGDDGRVKVADFGLARPMASGPNSATGGLLLGTVGYLAPEQVSEGRSDARSDVYAAGIVLFEMLTGQPPHPGQTPISVAYQQVHGEVPPPSSLNPRVGPLVDAFVLRATAQDPNGRPADGNALLADLHRLLPLLADDTPPAPLPSPSPLPPAPLPAATTALAGAGLATTALSSGAGSLAATSVASRVYDSTAYDSSSYDQPSGSTELFSPTAYEPLTGSTSPPGAGRRRARTAPGPDGRRTVVIAAVVVIALLIGVIALISGGGSTLRAPTLVGLDRASAVSKAQSQGFKAIVGAPAYDASTPVGQVSTQSPAPGAKIDKGATITLHLSLGTQKVAVPDVSGKSEADATAALRAKGLGFAGTQQQVNATVPTGQVVSTYPPAGTTVTPGSSVTLILSAGPGTVQIPDDLNGKTFADAQAELGSLGFTNIQRQDVTSLGTAGTVVGVSPDTGQKVQPTTQITLSVAKSLGQILGGDNGGNGQGATTFALPDVTGQKVRDAENALKSLGLNVKIIFGQRSGTVRSQSPGAGSAVSPGDTVTLNTLF